MSSERVDSDGKTGATSTGSDVQRQARTAAQQREADAAKDPEVLAKQIEETREDLAVTLDAIADKVSPKRVASRTKESVTETVKDKVAQAKVVVNEKTAQAKQVASEKTAQAKQAVEDRRSSSVDPDASSVRVDPAATTTTTTASAPGVDTPLPPVSGVEVPPLPTGRTATTSGTTSARGSLTPASSTGATLPPVSGVEVPPLRPAPGGTSTSRTGGALTPASSSASSSGSSPLAGAAAQALAGAGAAVVGLLLLLRRRRSRRG